MNAIIFDDKTKSAEISHTQLEQTMEVGNALAELPEQCPMQHGHLITKIVSDVQQYSGLVASVSPIIIREPYCQTNRKKAKESIDLELGDYLIRRLVARIDIPLEALQDTEDHVNASIAISYVYSDSIKGIQIAFGENVKVCENLATFGGFSFSTYGGSKVGFDDGMQLMHHWMQNLPTLHNKHIALIEQLKAVKVGRPGFQRIIGSLYEKAVRFNYGDKKVTAPLSQSEISQMVQKGLPVLQSEQEYLNGWEMMNWGTAVMKPHTSDMQHLLIDTGNFNTFLCNEFKIPIDLSI